MTSFSPDKGSPEFEEFLDFLGEKVELNGWTRYRAGLDVRGNFMICKNLSNFLFIYFALFIIKQTVLLENILFSMYLIIMKLCFMFPLFSLTTH